MSDSLIEAAAQLSNPIDRRVYGVAPAQVISNEDTHGEGRVQIMLPWIPGHKPWARVAMPMTGAGHGMYFMPQAGDEVLVAFGQGDVLALARTFVRSSFRSGDACNAFEAGNTGTSGV